MIEQLNRTEIEIIYKIIVYLHKGNQRYYEYSVLPCKRQLSNYTSVYEYFLNVGPSLTPSHLGGFTVHCIRAAQEAGDVLGGCVRSLE